MNKIKAFTLVELLLALGIVGAIAALTAPRLMDNINRKILTTQLKNIVGDIAYITDEQLLNKSSKIIGDTDFSDSAKLYSHFEAAQACSDDKNPCWASDYKKLSNMSTSSTIEIPSNADSIKLKNGASLYYTFGTTDAEWEADLNKKIENELIKEKEFELEKSTMKLLPLFAAISIGPGSGKYDNITKQKLATGGTFIVDVNGIEGPNVIGRDMFEFTISNFGRLSESTASLDTLKTNCKNGTASSCFNYLTANNWKMDY